jgi:hypothetical protein
MKDGLAYLSYWNEGLVILDVGKGIKGGSPENPKFVSQFKYDLNALYREVEAVGDPASYEGRILPGVPASMSSWEMKSSLPILARPRGVVWSGSAGLTEACTYSMFPISSVPGR